MYSFVDHAEMQRNWDFACPLRHKVHRKAARNKYLFAISDHLNA